MYDGSSATFEMLKRFDSVSIIAIKNGKLVILLEEQPSMGPAFYGLPGGVHDIKAETELEAAKRELREETGMTFRNWKLVKVIQPQAKIDWFNYFFIATDFETQTDTHPDPGEKIEVQLMDLKEVQNLMGHPSVRYLPDLLAQVSTVEELEALPNFEGVPVK